ncbi:RNA polymerase sigma factor [Actinoplanes utahensis]|uniref:RNA polymerase sigma factor n=1 Tax=Actinoplanes utahensis TaxID=1869 RepID=A0A0A6USA3_ACTUT|nr:sigma-70 family RNA polymerase sigma factor [Actinoplanes utahensis]KHD77324.1 RNA polymerase sigma factor [Actinoplanes utahensis]GIF32950.1 DNA-directed RNA polymerase sigma-70 factor [Actinoplanes utahensis]
MDTVEDRFTRLYRHHYPAVERYVRRRIEDADVRDVVADVFLVAWRRIGDVPPDPLPWLYGTARHVLANERRGAQRRTSLAARVAGHTDGESADHADTVAGRLSVAAAFDRLPDADAEALRLVSWEGLSLRQAARALDCSVPAFAMRLHRARARLRRELAPALSATTLEGELA